MKEAIASPQDRETATAKIPSVLWLCFKNVCVFVPTAKTLNEMLVWLVQGFSSSDSLLTGTFFIVTFCKCVNFHTSIKHNNYVEENMLLQVFTICFIILYF